MKAKKVNNNLTIGVFSSSSPISATVPALASSFGEFPPFVDMTFDNFKSVIYGGVALPYEYKMPSVWTDEFINWSQQDRGKVEYANSWVSVIPGICRGRLIGGNLNTMEGFFGTEYMPEIREGDILFIEDSLKDACTIERTFSMLKTGWSV